MLHSAITANGVNRMSYVVISFLLSAFLQATIKSSRKDFDLARTSKRPQLLIQEEDEVDSSKNSGLFEDIYPGLLSPEEKKRNKGRKNSTKG